MFRETGGATPRDSVHSSAPRPPGEFSSHPRSGLRGALQIAGLYVAVSVVWIVASDRVVEAIAPTHAHSQMLQTIKGSAFMLATGGLLALLIYRYFQRLEKLNAELKAGEQRQRQLLDDAPIPICIVRGGRFEDLNRAARRLLGDVDQPGGRTLVERAGEESRADVARVLSEVEATGHRAGLDNQSLLNAAGEEFSADLTVSRFAPDPGALQVVVVDTTERRRLEANLRQAHKMEAVGKLASGVSHEFNNLLTAILGYSALAKQSLPAQSAAARSLDQIDMVAKHAAGITRSLLTLSRAAPGPKEVVALRAFLADAANLIRGILPQTIALRIHTDIPGDTGARIDQPQLKQTLLNLALNAKDAMATGTLTVSTRLEQGPAGAEFPRAVIRVTDTGPGIPPAVMKQLFTPFFTTKPAGKGTGLGLPLAKSVVEEHGGVIEVESEPGRGTTFTIRLPAVRTAGVAAPPASTPAPAATQEAQVVLVGEDTPGVLDVVTIALRAAGYAVMPARDGPEVVRMVEQHRGRLDAMLLDVNLPGLSGLDCMVRARALHPDVPVLFMTGGSMPDLPPGHDRLIAWISKPFRTEALLEQLAALLEQRADAGSRR